MAKWKSLISSRVWTTIGNYIIHIHSSKSWFDSELVKMALPAEMDFEACRLQHIMYGRPWPGYVLWKIPFLLRFSEGTSESNSHTPRPIARIKSGEVRNSPKVDLLDPKSGLFEPHPLNPPTKAPFLAHFVATVDLLADLGGVSNPCIPLATGPAYAFSPEVLKFSQSESP